MRLLVEQLETRSLPTAAAATAVLANGVLTVQGTDQAETFTLRVAGANLTLAGPAKTWTFPLNAVAQIQANLGAGNDTWNGNAAGFRGSQIILAGLGNDSVATGQGNDILYGGEGNDRLIPGAGQDTVYGGNGNDTIDLSIGDGGQLGFPIDIAYGGAGNDTMLGGSNDFLYGEDGNDVLTAVAAGFNRGTFMSGGNGDDVFYAQQSPYRNYDVILGGAGVDRLATFDSIGGYVAESVNGIEKYG